MSYQYTYTLDSDSTYDHQGLLFSSAVGVVLLLVFSTIVVYFYYSPILWIKRFYRPSHTLPPPPLPPPHSPSSSCLTSPTHSLSHANSSSQGAAKAPTIEKRVKGAKNSVFTRRKRIGISLPFKTSLFYFPKYFSSQRSNDNSNNNNDNNNNEERKSFISRYLEVEEEVDHVQSVFAVEEAILSNSNNSSMQSMDRRSPPSQEIHHEQTPLSDGDSAHNRSNDNNNSYGSLSPPDHRITSSAAGGGGGGTTTTTTVNNNSNNNNNTAPKSPILQTIEDYIKTYHYKKISLDPQASLYLYTLRYVFTFLLVGQLFLIGIAWLANQEDAVEYFIVKKDLHGCNTTSHNLNETECMALMPFCTYVNLTKVNSTDSSSSNSKSKQSRSYFNSMRNSKSKQRSLQVSVRGAKSAEVVGQCMPRALRGIYDFSIKNIRPQSLSWKYVAMLDTCYVLLFLACFHTFVVRRMHPFIHRVMKSQVKSAIGYKVVCVRGLDEENRISKEAFKQRFLSPEAYFVSSSEAEGEGGEGSTAAERNRELHRVYEDGKDYYEYLDCNGLSCLFSILSCHYYLSTKDNALFTQPARVRQIFFSRRPPEHMHSTIHRTERDMAHLQEAVASEKALRRRLRYQTQQTLPSPSPLEASHGGVAGEEEGYLLEHRRPFPRCYETEKEVPYRVLRFTKSAKELNVFIEAVPLEKKNGIVYIIFDDALSAFEFVNFFSLRFGGWCSGATASLAGPPGHLIENNITVRKPLLLLRFFVLLMFYIVLLFTWSIPVGFVSSIENFANIPTVGNIFYRYYTTEVPAVIRNFITTFLPVAMLGLFNIILPFLIRFIVLWMGAINKSECDGGHLYLQYMFMILTAVLFQAPFQGFGNQIPDLIQWLNDDKTDNNTSGVVESVTRMTTVDPWTYTSTTSSLSPLPYAAASASSLANSTTASAYPTNYFDQFNNTSPSPPPPPPPPPPKDSLFSERWTVTDMVLNFLMDCYSPQGGYWFAKVITAIAFSCWIDLIDVVGLLKCVLFKRRYKVQRLYDQLFLPSFNWEFPRTYSYDLMILSMGLIFHVSTPLLHLLVLLYFFVRFITQRGKLLDRYRSVFPEPLLQNSTDFSVSAQVIRCIVGLFLLSEIGAAILHFIRGSPFSFFLSMVNLAVAGYVTFMAFRVTRTWTASLANVRRYYAEDNEAGAVASTTTTAEQPKPPPTTSEKEEEKKTRKDTHEGTTAKHITFREEAEEVPPTTVSAEEEEEEDSNSASTSMIHLTESFAGSFYHNNNSIYRNPKEKQEEEERLLRQLLDSTLMDNYETMFGGLFDDGNPFTGELLPRKKKIHSLYQPKHQKLEYIDVEKEVRDIWSSDYIVERYWDTHISWFENDIQDDEEAEMLAMMDSPTGQRPREQTPSPRHNDALVEELPLPPS